MREGLSRWKSQTAPGQQDKRAEKQLCSSNMHLHPIWAVKIFSNAHSGSDRFVIFPKRMELDEIDTTGAAAASKEERV